MKMRKEKNESEEKEKKGATLCHVNKLTFFRYAYFTIINTCILIRRTQVNTIFFARKHK